MRYEEIKIIIKNQNKRFKNKLFIFSLFLSFPYADTSDTTKETEEAPRKSSKVMIAETSNIVPRPAIETLKKSLLKSTSSSSVDRSLILDVRATEIRLPSPIPEDLVEEEISKQSTLSVMSDQEKKVEEKENAQERENDRKVNKEKTLEEQKEKEIVKEENKCQQSQNTEGNDKDNTEQQISETNKEIDAEKSVESDAKEQKSEVIPVQTTKMRGKSKATGQVMGGWI